MPPKRPRPILPSEDSSSKRLHASFDTSHEEKRFPCDQCDRSYADKSSLGRHQRETHPKPGEATRSYCIHCGGDFLRPDCVRIHIKQNRCPTLASVNAQRQASPHPVNPVTAPATYSRPPKSTFQFFIHSAIAEYRNLQLQADCLKMWRLEIYTRWREGKIVLDSFLADYEPEQENSQCTRRRSPCPWPFPPALEYPPPQDLEDLLSQQGRLRRRLRVMESFQLTHRKLLGGQQMSEYMSFLPSESWDNRIMDHQIHLKQAWKDGVSAVREILSGTLPRELHSVLGAAQIASAIRSAMDDVDSPITSEATFLSDLSRWRLLLPSDSQGAFDYFANILWDNIPPPALAWKEPHDAETLVYFQDLLGEMLSHIESPPTEQSELQPVLPSSDASSNPPALSTHWPNFSECVSDNLLPEVENAEELQITDNYKRTPLTELVLYSAGIIFALILAFIMLYTGHFSVQVLCLYLITVKPSTHDAQDQPPRPQHGVLLVNCWLLELLNQQLGLDRNSDDGTSIEDALDQEVQQPAMLGRLGWQQLIARCFEETAETAFIMSAL